MQAVAASRIAASSGSWCATGANVVVIAAGDLDYAEAQDDYVGLRSEGKVHLKQQTLAELEVSLDPARFVRIHRSYLLNVDRLARLESEGDDARGRPRRRHAPARQPRRLRASQGAAVGRAAASWSGSR